MRVYNYLKTNIFFILFFLLSLLSGFLRMYSLLQTDFANGWDGYFYLVQMQSLAETGKAHTGDASIIYFYLTAFYFLLQDYVVAFKIGISILVGIFTLLAILLTKKYATKKIALLVGMLILCSPHLTYFISQYPKNLLGITSLLLFWLIFPKEFFLKKNNLIYQIGILLPFLFLNYFSHKLTFFIALLWMFVFFLAKINQLKLIFIGICILIIISFFEINLTEYWSQWQRIYEALGGFSFVPYQFWESFGSERINIFWRIEIIASLSVLIFALFLISFASSKINLFYKTTIITLSLLLLPILKWDLEGISFRLFMLFGVLWVIIIGSFDFIISNYFKKFSSIVILLLFLLSFFAFSSYNPVLHDPTNKTYKKITDNFEKQSKYLDSDVKLLILHKSFAEYFTFRTKIDALPWLPESALKMEISEENIYRLATHIRKEEFEYYLEKQTYKKTKRLGLNYFLLKESDYQKMLKKVQYQNDTLLLQRMINHNYNPSRVRPLFLLQQKN